MGQTNLNNFIFKGGNQKDKKIIKLPEFQFFENRERLIELLTKEMDYASKKSEEDKETAIKVENMDPLEKEIFENGGLTNVEKEEKEKYWVSGFVEWNKDEFALFLKGCEKFGRKEYK
jgi:SWI/SNF-related matrix-associated actin-dependent regulator of chromatin subfamily A member 5